MSLIDSYLLKLHEDQLQEIDPATITTTLAVGSIAVITSFIMLLVSSSHLISSTKVNKELSENINHIMNSGNKWIIHTFNEKSPNAFSLGFGRHIFITSKMQKILTKDEQIAVLLHEVYHSSKKHTIKNLAYKYPLFYLCAFLAVTTTFTTGVFFLGFLAFFLANAVGDIAYNIIFSKRMEYNADSYAAKNGYGKELVSALKKIRNWAQDMTRNQPCGTVCQMARKADQAISEHPEMQKRIEQVLKQADKLYKVVKTGSYRKIKDFIMEYMGKVNG